MYCRLEAVTGLLPLFLRMLLFPCEDHLAGGDRNPILEEYRDGDNDQRQKAQRSLPPRNRRAMACFPQNLHEIGTRRDVDIVAPIISAGRSFSADLDLP
ncbi:hypothetical protein U1Q18_038358 [Sarracenia purpurea var. burkii]